MYINNKKRNLTDRELAVLSAPDYYTCIYYKSAAAGGSIREEFKTYKQAYTKAKAMTLPPINWDKRKFMFYAVKGSSSTFIGGLK
jgi:hypothetical protein